MNFNELYPKKKEYYHLLMDIKTTAECNVSNCVIDKQKAKLLMRYINKKEKEIERLNNRVKQLENQLKQKENIIKEVREILNQDKASASFNTAERTALGILDKENMQ